MMVGMDMDMDILLRWLLMQDEECGMERDDT